MRKARYKGNLYTLSQADAELLYQLFALNEEDVESNPAGYDFDVVHAYRCKGVDLIGSDCNTADPARHFLEESKGYTVYEIPAKTNRGLSVTGDFLVAIQDEETKHWFLAKMEHRFRVQDGMVYERVNYLCFGEAEVTLTPNRQAEVRCVEERGACCGGYRTRVFDVDNVRKYAGYHVGMGTIYHHFGIKRI